VPLGREQRIEWLYDWWAKIDAWIEENRPLVVAPERHLTPS
jgi:hypothetical protein